MLIEKPNKSSNFKYFLIGVFSTLLIITIILGAAYIMWGHPYLVGLSYNLQLDEATLMGLGIHPTADNVSMYNQMINRPCYVGDR